MIHRSGIVNGERIYESALRRLPENATDLKYAISSHQSWRPGVYDSERAARYAFRFDDATLQALQPYDGVITFEMLQATRRTLLEQRHGDEGGGEQQPEQRQQP